MITVDDQVKINEMMIEREELYCELMEMVDSNNYDIDEIQDINHEIEELDERLLVLNSHYVPILKKLI